MPKSKIRKKPKSQQPVAPTAKAKAVKIGPKPWVMPLMVGLFLVGLLWIVLFYLTRGDLPIKALSNWNLLVGFAFIGAGFAVSTRWR